MYMSRARFFLSISIVFLYGIPAMAADRAPALPPPTKVQDTPVARETVNPPGDRGLLGKEFAAPKAGKDVRVRIYKRRNGAVVEEYSLHGRIYMVKVKPATNTPAYYLYDSDGDGTLERRLPGGYKYIKPPMWIIRKF